MAEPEPTACLKDDTALEHWTVLRFVVLGGIMLVRLHKITKSHTIDNGSEAETESALPHSELRKSMEASTNIVTKMMWAFIIWVQEEGVGFVIYFGVSATMDNVTIFLLDDVFHDEGVVYCEYVKQTALYSMALLSFLPCVLVALTLQDAWYAHGEWMGTKGGFLALMIVVTMVSFCARLFVVFNMGWASLVKDLLTPMTWRVEISVLVPPLVDAVQSVILIFASGHACHEEEEDDHEVQLLPDESSGD